MRYDHKEVGGRVAPGALTENYVRNTTSMEGGVRVKQEARTE
jgi:hypothetical protein